MTRLENGELLFSLRGDGLNLLSENHSRHSNWLLFGVVEGFGGADGNDSEEAEHDEQSDPEEVRATLGEWPGVGALAEGWIKAFRTELRGVKGSGGREETSEVVARGRKGGVAVEESEGLGGGGVEAELTLARLETDGGDG